MELARVQGTVVSTIKAEKLSGCTLLVVNILNSDATPSEKHLIAIDSVGAGTGEVVLVVRGSSARQTQDLKDVPTDCSIVAIVDSVELQGKIVYAKNKN
ncbi:MAG: ethanolamine utilization protein EutN [Calditrichaeota bacterium]|nr:MAG: ethanolamine utilization protein EutN [Calditrichota bacterium]